MTIASPTPVIIEKNHQMLGNSMSVTSGSMAMRVAPIPMIVSTAPVRKRISARLNVRDSEVADIVLAYCLAKKPGSRSISVGLSPYLYAALT